MDIMVKGNGWPDVYVDLTPDPTGDAGVRAKNPIYGSNSQLKSSLFFHIYCAGLPMYALVGYSQMDEVPLTIDSISLVDTMTGEMIRSEPTSKFTHPQLGTMYSAVVGPFDAPCQYFDVVVREYTTLSALLALSLTFCYFRKNFILFR